MKKKTTLKNIQIKVRKGIIWINVLLTGNFFCHVTHQNVPLIDTSRLIQCCYSNERL